MLHIKLYMLGYYMYVCDKLFAVLDYITSHDPELTSNDLQNSRIVRILIANQMKAENMSKPVSCQMTDLRLTLSGL